MSERETIVEALKRLGPEHVVEGLELCPACDGLSPGLGSRRNESGEIEDCIVNCGVCHNKHAVTVEDADRWRRSLLLKRSIGMRIQGVRIAYQRPHRWVSA
jgi:hypothetical protein